MPTNERKREIRQQCEIEAQKTAQIVGASAWYDNFRKVVTDDELKEIFAHWETMPGSSSLAGAFLDWVRPVEILAS